MERGRIKAALPPTFFGIPPGCLLTPPPSHGSCPLSLEREIAAISARLFVTPGRPRTASVRTASQVRAHRVKRHGRRRKKLKSGTNQSKRSGAHTGKPAKPRSVQEPKSRSVPPSSLTKHNDPESTRIVPSLGATKSGNAAFRSPKASTLAPVKDLQAFENGDFIKSEQNEPEIKPAYKPAKSLDSYKIDQQDWALFTSPNTLPQQAGVQLRLIRRLVLKELTDNGLDMVRHLGLAGEVSIHQDGPHTFTVRDNGPGLDGTPEQIASLFSLNRPMTSSKRWRRPTRGAIGNGLRVVTGSVISAAGRIIVRTRNMRITLRPQIEDGSTTVEKMEAIDFPVGTAITVEIDPIYE